MDFSGALQLMALFGLAFGRQNHALLFFADFVLSTPHALAPLFHLLSTRDTAPNSK